MKTLLKRFVTAVLTQEMWVRLWRERATIIGITGSVGKTSTKDAVFSILQHEQKTYASKKSYNSAIGVALAVLGLDSAYSSALGWVKNIGAGFFAMLRRKGYDVMVLEMGVDRPKDFNEMLRYVHPQIGVVTAIGEVPSHVEFFSGPEAVAREKGKLIRALPQNGYAVLNGDDPLVREMAEKTKAQVLFYGESDDVDVRATNFQILREDTIPVGITFKLEYAGKSVPIRIYGAFGRQQVQTALAAATVGIARGMNLIVISEALREYTPPPGRLRRIEGQKESIILDDTYNASPIAMHAALEVLDQFEAHRKVAVLGDMLELGKFAVAEHEKIGERVASVADVLITVGPRAKFIAERAEKKGMKKEHIFVCSDYTAAAKQLEKELKEKDVVLVKGSQGVRLEHVVLAIMERPQDAPALLVRQEAYWKGRSYSPKKEVLQKLIGVGLLFGGVVGLFINVLIGILLFAIGVLLVIKK